MEQGLRPNPLWNDGFFCADCNADLETAPHYATWFKNGVQQEKMRFICGTCIQAVQADKKNLEPIK